MREWGIKQIVVILNRKKIWKKINQAELIDIVIDSFRWHGYRSSWRRHIWTFAWIETLFLWYIKSTKWNKNAVEFLRPFYTLLKQEAIKAFLNRGTSCKTLIMFSRQTTSWFLILKMHTIFISLNTMIFQPAVI